MAFDKPSLELRSGCDLTRLGDVVGFELDGGAVDEFEVSAADALEVFEALRERASKAGLVMDRDVIAVSANPALSAAVTYALTQAAPDVEG